MDRKDFTDMAIRESARSQGVETIVLARWLAIILSDNHLRSFDMSDITPVGAVRQLVERGLRKYPGGTV